MNKNSYGLLKLLHVYPVAMMFHGDPSRIFSRPIAFIFLSLALAFVIYKMIRYFSTQPSRIKLPQGGANGRGGAKGLIGRPATQVWLRRQVSEEGKKITTFWLIFNHHLVNN